MSSFTLEATETLAKKKVIIEQLSNYRKTLFRLFQDVVGVAVDVSRETGTKVVNFNNDVINDLPDRIKGTLMNELREWIVRRGNDVVFDNKIEQIVELDIETHLVGADAVSLTIYDRVTGYRIYETITFADLAPFLQAGLDWQPTARSFFIPRS